MTDAPKKGWFSRLTEGRLIPAPHPYRAAACVGEFRYVVEGYAGHDTTNHIDDGF